MWTWAIAIALAGGADRPFVRVDEPLTVRWYYKVEGGDHLTPVRPRWRRKRGPIHAWTFPDGVAEHYETWEDDTRTSVVRLNTRGRPATTVHLDGDQPTRVEVHGRAELAVADWSEESLEDALVRAPGTARRVEDGLEWDADDWTLTVRWTEAGDVFGDAYRDQLREACGCVLDDRSTVWADGHQGARYRVRSPHPTSPQVGEVWAFPRTDRTLVVALVAREGSEPGLALGRAVVAMLRFEDPR